MRWSPRELLSVLVRSDVSEVIDPLVPTACLRGQARASGGGASGAGWKSVGARIGQARRPDHPVRELSMGALVDGFGGKIEGERIRAADWNGILAAVEALVTGVQQAIEAQLTRSKLR